MVAVVILGGMTVRSVVAAAVSGGGDFATVYAAARVWSAGGDPYDAGRVAAAFDAAGGPAPVRPTPYWTPPVYPPGTLAVVAPLARLRWPSARAAWAVLSGLSVAGMVAVLPAVAGLRWGEPRGLLIVIGTLLLTPTRAGVAIGQPAVPAAGLIVIACSTGRPRNGAGDRSKPVSEGTPDDPGLRAYPQTPAWRHLNGSLIAGLSLGVATCLKPQLAGPFVAYLMVRGRWWAAGVAVGLFAAVTVGAALHLARGGVPWWAEWTANVARTTTPGGVNDAAAGGVNRFAMVNLAVGLGTFTGSPAVPATIVAVVTAGAFAVTVRRRPPRPAAELAFVAAWSLLPVYHRWYDAGPLALAVAWAAAAWPARAAVAVVVLLVPFTLSLIVRLPAAIPGPHGWLWDHVLMPNQCWAVTGLAGVLLWAVWRPPEASPA